MIFSFEQASPIRQVMYLPLVEAALRYGIVGALALTAASAPVMAGYEWLRSDRFAPHRYRVDYVTLQLGLEVLMGLIVGWLMLRLLGQTTVAEARAAEAERLRDQLGRRADVLEAANRCARALSSSLELDQAFDAFIREVRGLLPFDRIAIVLSENGVAQVMAVAGAGADDVLPAGLRPADPRDAARGAAAHEPDGLPARHELADYPEEDEFLALGLHCRLATPLLQGARAIGMLSLVRREPRRLQRRRTSSSRACSGVWWQARCRTSAPTRASARRSRSCGASRRCGPTSSRSSRTSCARRWPR